ncbi:MAG: outer membrane protein assembly factor BamA [Bacteroidales bacterium]|nr:outer membrane protein assembly factor BamA [Bacteroidales bacterium]
MYRKIIASFCVLCAFTFVLQKGEAATSEKNLPEIYYSSPREYKIADIAVTGIDNYEDYVLKGLSGLSIGQVIKVPGDEITEAMRRYWKHGLFSDVKILATKIEGNQVWLEVQLKPRPRISEIKYIGIKKSDREDLEKKLNLVVGNQITPNMVDRSVTLIRRHYDEKGFKNATVDLIQKEDPKDKGQVIVEIRVDRKDKIKINQLIIDGNVALSDYKVSRAMKKTNQKGKLANFFRTKKFVETEYEKDKIALIAKYNEYGYRDAIILEDTVYRFDNKTVNVYIKLDEGKKYYHRDIKWVGNSVYTSDQLNHVLMINRGDVYNQKRLDERLNTSKDEDAVSNMYMDNGYLFSSLTPVEVKVDGDSIDLEIRVHEDRQATINRININGNDRLYENVIRRELRVKPGALFSKSDLMRSAREIAQMGHFDAENMGIVPIPDYEAGTVDVDLNLTPKNNDQVEFSAGWGSTGIVGSISLKFTNFSIRNLLNLGTYKILPQGDGQTFSITGRSNGDYYSSYSFSFLDPWFGGKRPNSLQISGFYSHQSDVSSRYYSNYSNYYNSMYSGYGSSYGSSYGYGTNDSYMNELDPDKYLKMWGLSAGIGGRLNWPDDYFQLYGELSYQHYSLQNWSYFVISNGISNDLSMSLTLSRKSIDNPLFTRSGSDFSLSVQATLPYSSMDKLSNYDYANMTSEQLYKWIEYYKIKFKSKTYTPISANKKLILMTRFDMGYIGAYNVFKRSPFGAFYLGGDGTTGYSSNYTYETIALRGYENGALGTNSIYERVGLELHYPLMMETSTTIYALTFLEAGNGWSLSKAWNPLNLKRSAGIGVRIYLPMVGLMGIDWAYGFDKVSGATSPSGSQFHFILGQEF